MKGKGHGKRIGGVGGKIAREPGYITGGHVSKLPKEGEKEGRENTEASHRPLVRRGKVRREEGIDHHLAFIMPGCKARGGEGPMNPPLSSLKVFKLSSTGKLRNSQGGKK